MSLNYIEPNIKLLWTSVICLHPSNSKRKNVTSRHERGGYESKNVSTSRGACQLPWERGQKLKGSKSINLNLSPLTRPDLVSSSATPF